VWYDTKIPEVVPRPPHLPLEGVGILFPGPNATPLRRRRSGASSAEGVVKELVVGGGGGGGGDEDDVPPPPTHLVVLDTTVGLHKLTNPVKTHSLKPPGFKP
jgi:hypothetical protein